MSDFLRAARYTDTRNPLPHQIAAWTWAWEQLTPEQQAEFLEMFRAAVADKSSGTVNSWAGIAEAAKRAGAKYPELVAAQWALESGWGRYMTGANNVFGQKGTPGTLLTPSEGGPPVEFLDFPSLFASVQYLVDRWYKDFRGYTGVNHAPSRDIAAQMLMDEGYCGIPPQNPSYAKALIRLMDQNSPLSVLTAAPPSGAPEMAGMVGPAKAPALRSNDFHLVLCDRAERMNAFDATGRLLWSAPALGRGQGRDTDWRTRNTDTPPGLYRLGKLYADYEQNPSPPCSDTAMGYGWYSFDMEELEGQEVAAGRAGIMLHGGGSACGWPGAWAPQQSLHPTLGCVRMHNVDLRDKVLPLYRRGIVYLSVYQEQQ